jgi:hypothetical protein
MDKHKLTIKRTVDELGLKMVSLTQGRSHLRVEVTDGEKSSRFTTPLTPSDSRWRKNFISDVRKVFK